MQAVVFMAGFAAAWWAAGILAAQRPWPVAIVGIAVSVGLLLLARARLQAAPAPDPAERKRRGRIVGWAAGLEGVAIVVVANLLNNNGLGAYLFPAIAVIVGLHFLPLAKLLPVPVYYPAAVLLVLLGVGGGFIDPALRPLAVGAGSAAILWLTCLARIFEPAGASA